VVDVAPSLNGYKNLEYVVVVGYKKLIKVPGVTKNFKIDGSLESISIEHLTNKTDYAKIFVSKDPYESAFSFSAYT
jgi:hypothetical protein